MVSILKGKLPHKITWWAVTGGDGFGGDQVAAPVLIDGRWEDREEKFVGLLDRREHVSNAIVIVDRDMALGDYLCLGDQTSQVDPSLATGAYKIQVYRKISDLRNLDYVRRVIL